MRWLTAAPESTTLTFDYPDGAYRPEPGVSGAEVVEEWDSATERLTLTFSHRGVVQITVN